MHWFSGGAIVIGVIAGIIEIGRFVSRFLGKNPRVAWLIVFGALCLIGLGAGLVLLNSQANLQGQAQSLLRSLPMINNYGEVDAEFRSDGTNQGIVVETVDFFGPYSSCLPGAFQQAENTLRDAKTQARETSDPSQIWINAAESAYQQVQAVAKAPPACR
jgi:hypothetical protein